MCGIGGIVWRKKGSALQSAFLLSSSLAHRGPDSSGYLLFQKDGFQFFDDVNKAKTFAITSTPHLVLIHRRLAIIDLTKAGCQPMEYDNGRLWITYNGEIYNYIELREELKLKGYKFKTNTDTEVILASYDLWGKDCVHKFNGMWAFVILDTKRNILFGSRDRFGVKPLYFSISSDFFVFSSEIKAILKLPFIKKEINPKAVFQYLMFDLEEGEEQGFIKGIYELMPSFAFEYDIRTNELKKWRYYELSFETEYKSFEHRKFCRYTKDVKKHIFDAVKIRLRSDVPIGSCLSGGIDSSSIVCVINELLKTNSYPQVYEKKLFTASFKMGKIDESKWAKLVSEYTKGKWYPVFPNHLSLMEDIEDLVYTQDIPFGSLSIYAQYCVMRKAKKENVKVMMDGQGADELFTGYISYYWPYLKELIKNDKLSALRELFSLKNSPLSYSQIIYALNSLLKKGSPYGSRYDLLSRYINKDLVETFKREEPLLSNKVTGYKTDSLNHVLYNFMTGPRLKSLLRYEDRNSMRFSIETRTPFSDDVKLIETVFAIPSSYKIRNGWSKFLLRSAMKGIVPTAILKRREKIGFTVPEAVWLRRLKHSLLDLMSKDTKEFINLQLLIKEWDIFLKAQPNIGITGLWRFINLGIWRRIFSL